MKKISLSALLLFLIRFTATAQTKNVPSVIALYPNEIKSDSVSSVALSIYKNDSALNDTFRKGYIKPGLAPNWKTIREKELDYMEKQDFFSILVLTITRELTYKEVENRSNLLIYPIKEKSASSLIAYKKIADQNNVSWLVNFTKVETHSIGDKHTLIVSVQLYNSITPRLFLDKTFTLDSSALKESESCNETWHCLSEQIASLIVIELADKIERNIRFVR
jgi:hypothetical protein